MVVKLLLAFLLGLSVYASYTDIRSRKISNLTVLAVFIFSLTISYLTSVLNESWIVASKILLVGFVLSCFGVIAAGDIKLLTAYSLAINPEFILLVLIMIGLIGGLIALFYLIKYFLKGRNPDTLMRGIPYGVPISLSCGLGIVLTVLSSPMTFG
ncbi:A24 family peptidase [Photobacterium sp. J15]|uniref:A24 family peptidase n=1 Tax=Photobacterium sp. J15 TaxID=265901 RepID=UPI0007E4480A|nr:prepilin peptidase [Photobacterium sp. J15]